MLNNFNVSIKKRNCEGQFILPFLTEWYCFLCRTNKVEKPIVKGYLGGKREKYTDKILNLHLTCTLFISDLHLYFSSTDGFEVYNLSKVQTEDYQCFICQDSGNPKKGYSIKCIQESCNQKIHLACVNKAKIYQKENEQNLLKCFAMCRNHARLSPLPFETTYGKLHNEIQQQWIQVYKQLEEQEKQRQQEEKELLHKNKKGKNNLDKRKFANRYHNKHTHQEQNETSQQESYGTGNNNYFATTSIDIYQESTSQFNQNSELQDSKDQINDRKRRGRPTKNKDISPFSKKNSIINQNQPEKMQQSEEINDLQDSTCKKVFIETNQEIRVLNRDNQFILPFDNSVGDASNNEDLTQINGSEPDSIIQQKNTLEEKIQNNQILETPNAYMQLFGTKAKIEEKITIDCTTSIYTSSPLLQSHVDQPQNINPSSLLESSQLSYLSKRIFRQDSNKKHEKQGNLSSTKKGQKRNDNNLDDNIVNENMKNSSIYDNPFNKFLFNQQREDDQNQLENTQIKQANISQQNQLKSDKDDIDQEEEEVYLECGYPNFNDEKREENMENWWFKIDSEYFTSPPNSSSIIQDLLYTLKIQNDYLKTQYISQFHVQKEHSKKKNNDYKYIYYPKQMSQDIIKEFSTASIVDLYFKKQKELNNNEDIFGYQFDDENLEEDINFNEKQESEETNLNELKGKKSESKIETLKQKQKNLNKKQQNENIKESKKLNTNKNQVKHLKAYNYQINNSGISNQILEENETIKQEINEQSNQGENEIKQEEENQKQFISLMKEQIDQSDQNEQQNIIKQQLSGQSDEQSIDIEKDIFKDDPIDQKQEMDIEQQKQEFIEKKEEQNEYQDITYNSCDQELKELKNEDIEQDEKYSSQVSKSAYDLNCIKKEDQLDSNQINIYIQEKDNKQSKIDTISSLIRQNHISNKQLSENKQKYIDYYSQEYIHESLPLKINKKFNVLFNSVEGDGYLIVYDVNENSDIKRSLTSKNKSEYQIYGSLKDTQKLSKFYEIYSETQAPGIDENNRRRAIPTSETTPQLMLSKVIHLNDEAMKMSIQEQLDINRNLYKTNKNKVKGDQIDQMSLRTLFFEKQWSLIQNRFLDWQNQIYKQIEQDKDLAYYKKQTTLIWDMLKLSQTKKTIILGYAYKEKYNTEIYFMTNSEDSRDNDRGYKNNSNKQNIPNKMPAQQPSNIQQTANQLNLYNQSKNQDQNVQITQNFNNFKEQNLNQDQSSNIQLNNPQDQNLSLNNGEILESMSIESNLQKVTIDELSNNEQFEKQDQSKSRMKILSNKNNQLLIGKKNRKGYDQNESEKDSKDIQNQESQQQQQKLKLRVRKPPNKMQQSKPKLSAYMKAKQKQINNNLQDRNLENSKHPLQKGSTIFETIKKVKLIPLAKRIKKNPQLKQKEQLETDCMICFSQKNTDNNPVVYCSDCQVSFHKICYGIEDLPEGKYFCDKCEIIRTLRHKERFKHEILQQRFCCPLCVETELPIKLIYQRQNSRNCEEDSKHTHNNYGQEQYNSDQYRQNIDKSISHEQIEHKLNSHGELWMHPFCMFTFNLAKFQDGEIILKNTDFPTPSNNQQTNLKKDKVSSNSSINSDDIFTGVKCYFCEKNHGRTIKCSDNFCNQHFHPLCSFFQGLQCKLIEKPNFKEIKSNNSQKQSNRNSSMKNNKINANKYDIDEDILIEQDLLEFQIRCKKHILLDRIDIPKQDIQNSQEQTQENIYPEITHEIKQLQQNLKQDIDYYLKQIFYRRFGVNYEKICSNFYYYEDFHEEVYEKQNLKIKFYNSHLNEYQTLPEILQFIQFGPQPKKIPKENEDVQNKKQSSNSCQSKNKKTVEFEDFEFEMESDYDDDDDEEYKDKEKERIEDDEENKEEDEEIDYDEKEDDEEEDEEENQEDKLKDENMETHDSNNDTSYSQNFQIKNQKKGESVLQPVQTYRKPSKQQRQQKKMKFEEDLNENQSETNNEMLFQNNQFKSIDEDNEQSLNEDKILHSIIKQSQNQKQSEQVPKNINNNEKYYSKNKKESEDDDLFNDIELDDLDEDEEDQYDLNSYEDQNQNNLNENVSNNYKENSEDYRSSS